MADSHMGQEVQQQRITELQAEAVQLKEVDQPPMHQPSMLRPPAAPSVMSVDVCLVWS